MTARLREITRTRGAAVESRVGYPNDGPGPLLPAEVTADGDRVAEDGHRRPRRRAPGLTFLSLLRDEGRSARDLGPLLQRRGRSQ